MNTKTYSILGGLAGIAINECLVQTIVPEIDLQTRMESGAAAYGVFSCAGSAVGLYVNKTKASLADKIFVFANPGLAFILAAISQGV